MLRPDPVHALVPPAVAQPSPDDWPELGYPTPGARTRVSAAVARRLFVSAVERLDVTVRLGDGDHRPLHRSRRPAGGRAPPRRALRPTRPRPADRLRRGLPDRRLGRARPRRLPHRARGRAALAGARPAAEAPRCRGAPAAAAPPQRGAQHPGQHRPPLRPVQRPVPAVPRPVAELLLGAVRRLPARPRRPPAGRHAARRPTSPTPSRPGRAARSSGCSTRPACGAGTRVLEIGSGWGELAIRAARRGATVRTITLSTEQRALARERIAAAGVADRVDVDLCDYRDVTGAYDAVLSVEMIEAVGHEYWSTYFADHRPGARPRRAGGDPGDHDAARPDAGDPAHLHLDQQVHLPRRLPAVGAGARRGRPATTPGCG